MGRKARLKRSRKEQTFANALVDEMIHDGPADLTVDEWSDLPAPTGSGQTVYVRSAARRFVDAANAARPNDPQYTGAWVAETITPDADTSHTDHAARRHEAARRADEAAQQDYRRQAYIKPQDPSPRAAIGAIFGHGLMLLADAMPSRPHRHAPSAPPKPDGRFTRKRRR